MLTPPKTIFKKIHRTLVFMDNCLGMQTGWQSGGFYKSTYPRELYARQFGKDSLLFAQWENALELVFKDSLRIELPYAEQGKYFEENAVAYSYNLKLYSGEVFHAEVRTDSLSQSVFLGLYQKSTDSLKPYDFLSRSEHWKKRLEKVIEKLGNYKLILQPGFHIETSFQLKIYTMPLYAFPVARKDNRAIQSLWGASRAGGQRSHQSVDIFADRGTPVVAVTEGWVSLTGERGIGGKQVLIRTDLFGNSLYYAHLDSIAISTGKRVVIDDTLSLFGVTGKWAHVSTRTGLKAYVHTSLLDFSAVMV